MIRYLLGLILRPISCFVSVRDKCWVFGADYGMMYREGSKYLLEYMLKEHPDYHVMFITRDKDVIRELHLREIPVAHNYSWKGIWNVLTADCVFTCQSQADIFFAYKKKGRKFFYLIHGQPFKRAVKMLPRAYFDSINHRNSLSAKVAKIKEKIAIWIAVGNSSQDISFVSATSEFTATLLRKEYDKNVDVKVLGMPRNDALFQHDRMKSERWIDGIEDKYIVTYMPTHRKYGKGQASPIPFLHNESAQQWMRENNIVLLVKQHPNMITTITDAVSNDVIVDISKTGLDPQVVIYHSDVLITDYSSVWMDFLLLRRPLIFYFYDNFENEDAGCYYDLREEFPHNYCEDERSLLMKMKNIIANRKDLVLSDKTVGKFHRYVDGLSCQRYFNEIKKIEGYDNY